jgi:ubiquinone/menaquinone biosynthesis C-methylase UbiE
VVRGFTRASLAYERARPEYPDQARDFVARTFQLGPGKTVVEIGGGTGKWTRQLVRTGAEVIVVEPVPAMHRQLRRAVPGVRVLARRGEETRLPSASADLVTVAQAMHWLDGPRALEEFDRILRPGGGVAVIYNERRERGVRGPQLRELLDRYRPRHARLYTSGAWKWAFRQSQTFAPLSLFRYKNQQVLDREAMLDRYRSISFVSALPPRRQRAFFCALARVLDEEALRTGSGRYTLHYHGKIFWTRRRGD